MASGDWTVQQERNPLNDSARVFMFKAADDGKSSMGRSVTLVLRCDSGKTQGWINWSDYLGSEASVTWRFGTEAAKTSDWPLSTDQQATFFPGSQANEIEFVKKLMTVDTFVAQVTPYSESPVTGIWDVRGLTEAIKPLRAACGW